ncbi:hypothetical protein CCHR01_19298 [Colletotrichum chrysophilum]|uniref:Uncharacterized protein n=1 Tax=Colletotrichum chrysophilum TaxID=1836956 RepID=A0AAD8ZYQ9_9PEZI|nr:hypothetical protein CCHR01_19298 [Colletotrichum chrysophilum]
MLPSHEHQLRANTRQASIRQLLFVSLGSSMPVAARPLTSRPCHGHDTPGSYTRGWLGKAKRISNEPSKLDSMLSSVASAQPRAPLYILDGACGWLPGEQRAIFMPAVSQHTAPVAQADTAPRSEVLSSR